MQQKKTDKRLRGEWRTQNRAPDEGGERKGGERKHANTRAGGVREGGQVKELKVLGDGRDLLGPGRGKKGNICGEGRVRNKESGGPTPAKGWPT